METLQDIFDKQHTEKAQGQRKTNLHGKGNEYWLTVESFKRKFPTPASVFDWYKPSRWGHCLNYQQTLLDDPCIFLADLDTAYSTNGMAENILKEQFLALYKLSTAKEPFVLETASVAAGIFLGTHGKQCTLNHMMLYFARYPMQFKETFALFDTSDILRQYGSKFLPWVQSQDTAKDEPYRPATNEPRGKEALHKWLREAYILKGRNPRESNLYIYGVISEQDIIELETQARQ